MEIPVARKKAWRLPIIVEIFVIKKITQNVAIAETVPDQPAYSAPSD